jgi:pimeloyl-ACP methyl ester carboxylesterase
MMERRVDIERYARHGPVPYEAMARMRMFPSSARPAPPWAAKRASDDYGARATPDWREIDWREHLRRTEIGGRSVNYVDLGEGGATPIVFVHGLAGNWQNWLEQLPRFSQERRVVALDLPGHGHSEMPADEISISGFGRCVDALCDQLGLERVAVVGNSMGGFVSAEVAIQFPERVERLVLVTAAGITTSDVRREPILAWGRIFAAAGTRTAARVGDVIRRPRLKPFVYGTIMRHPNRIPMDLLFEITAGAGKPGFLPALEAILEYDFRDRLPDIRCPTLIVWGEDDMLVPVRDASEYERTIPTARKVVLEDTGHVPQIERPKRFNDCVAEWLASDPESVGEPARGEEASAEAEAA